MTEIMDSDVRHVLEKIARENGLNLESKVNLPFKSVMTGRFSIFKEYKDVRTYDKVYTLNDLTVSLQAKLGEKSGRKGFREIRDYLVINGGEITNERIGRILSYFDSDLVVGPIVKDIDDVDLKTITVESVLVQYSTLPLENFKWEFVDLINRIKEKYGLEILSKNDGIIYSNNHSLDFSGSLADLNRVFSKKIRDKEGLEQGIRNVYLAGKTLIQAIDYENEVNPNCETLS